MIKKLCIMLLLAMAANEVLAATAENLYWNGSANSVLNNKANWRRSSNTGSTVCTELDSSDTLYIDKSTGTLTNTGSLASSKWCFGYAAAANYTINDTGTITVGSSTFLTRAVGATGVYNKNGGTYNDTSGTYISWKGGTATLNIASGATWTTAGELLIEDRGGSDTGGIGTLNLNGGTVNVAGTFKITNTSGTGTFNLNSGTFNSNSTAAQTLITGGIGNMTIGNGGKYYGHSDLTFVSGNTSGTTSTLKINAGGLFSNTGNLVVSTGAVSSSMDIYGTGTTSGRTTVSSTSGAAGTLRVRDGATYTTNGLTVAAGGSTNVYVYSGGTLKDTGGSVFASSDGAYGYMSLTGSYNTTGLTLSNASGAEGFMRINSGGVLTNTGNTTLATAGTGTLTIYNGGTANVSGTTTLASGGTGTLNVVGAYNTGSTTLIDGAGAQGTLNINSGGVYTTGSGRYLRSSGTGTININNGGILNATGSTFFARAAGANGTLNTFIGGTYNMAANSYFSISREGGNGVVNVYGSFGDFSAQRGNSRICIAEIDTAGTLNVDGGTLKVGYIQFGWDAATAGTMIVSGTANVEVSSTTNDAGLVLGTNSTYGIAGEGANKIVLVGSRASVHASRLTMGSNDMLQFFLDGTYGAGNGINLTYEATLAGVIGVSFTSAPLADTYTLLKAENINISDLTLTGLEPEWRYEVVNSIDGQELQITCLPIPEPATICLFALGTLTFFVRRK